MKKREINKKGQRNYKEPLMKHKNCLFHSSDILCFSIPAIFLQKFIVLVLVNYKDKI